MLILIHCGVKKSILLSSILLLNSGNNIDLKYQTTDIITNHQKLTPNESMNICNILDEEIRNLQEMKISMDNHLIQLENENRLYNEMNYEINKYINKQKKCIEGCLPLMGTAEITFQSSNSYQSNGTKICQYFIESPDYIDNGIDYKKYSCERQLQEFYGNNNKFVYNENFGYEIPKTIKSSSFNNTIKYMCETINSILKPTQNIQSQTQCRNPDLPYINKYVCNYKYTS